MARKPRTTTSKARSARKASTRTASKKRATPKKAAPKKAASRRTAASRAQTRRRESAAPDWAGAIDTLIASANGREVLANVLEAAAEALRTVVSTGPAAAAETGVQQVIETSEAAAEIGTEVTSGTVALAQTAAGVLAGVATEAARRLLTETVPETAGRGQRRRGTERNAPSE